MITAERLCTLNTVIDPDVLAVCESRYWTSVVAILDAPCRLASCRTGGNIPDPGRWTEPP